MKVALLFATLLATCVCADRQSRFHRSTTQDLSDDSSSFDSESSEVLQKIPTERQTILSGKNAKRGAGALLAIGAGGLILKNLSDNKKDQVKESLREGSDRVRNAAGKGADYVNAAAGGLHDRAQQGAQGIKNTSQSWGSWVLSMFRRGAKKTEDVAGTTTRNVERTAADAAGVADRAAHTAAHTAARETEKAKGAALDIVGDAAKNVENGARKVEEKARANNPACKCASCSCGTDCKCDTEVCQCPPGEQEVAAELQNISPGIVGNPA